MRIEPTDASQINSTASAEPKALEVNRAAVNSGASQPGEDSVDLGQVSVLAEKAMNQPEVRMEKVEAIKAQIAAGTYAIDAASIADAIISESNK